MHCNMPILFTNMTITEVAPDQAVASVSLKNGQTATIECFDLFPDWKIAIKGIFSTIFQASHINDLAQAQEELIEFGGINCTIEIF